MFNVLENRFWRTTSWLMVPLWAVFWAVFGQTLNPVELNRQFYDAAWSYNRDAQRDLLNHGADINWQRPEFDGNTVLNQLIETCVSGTHNSAADAARSHGQMWYLLKQGADPNVRNRRGETALRIAEARKDHDAVKLLKEFGATH